MDKTAARLRITPSKYFSTAESSGSGTRRTSCPASGSTHDSQGRIDVTDILKGTTKAEVTVRLLEKNGVSYFPYELTGPASSRMR